MEEKEAASEMPLCCNQRKVCDQVADYLESDLQSKGWTVLPVQEVPTGSVIQGSKDGRNVTVLVSHLSESGDEYATMIMVSVQR